MARSYVQAPLLDTMARLQLQVPLLETMATARSYVQAPSIGYDGANFKRAGAVFEVCDCCTGVYASTSIDGSNRGVPACDGAVVCASTSIESGLGNGGVGALFTDFKEVGFVLTSGTIVWASTSSDFVVAVGVVFIASSGGGGDGNCGVMTLAAPLGRAWSLSSTSQGFDGGGQTFPPMKSGGSYGIFPRMHGWASSKALSGSSIRDLSSATPLELFSTMSSLLQTPQPSTSPAPSLTCGGAVWITAGSGVSKVPFELSSSIPILKFTVTPIGPPVHAASKEMGLGDAPGAAADRGLPRPCTVHEVAHHSDDDDEQGPPDDLAGSDDSGDTNPDNHTGTGDEGTGDDDDDDDDDMGSLSTTATDLGSTPPTSFILLDESHCQVRFLWKDARSTIECICSGPSVGCPQAGHVSKLASGIMTRNAVGYYEKFPSSRGAVRAVDGRLDHHPTPLTEEDMSALCSSHDSRLVQLMADLGGPSGAASVSASVADPVDLAIPSPLRRQVSNMFGAMRSIRETIGARTLSLPSETNFPANLSIPCPQATPAPGPAEPPQQSYYIGIATNDFIRQICSPSELDTWTERGYHFQKRFSTLREALDWQQATPASSLQPAHNPTHGRTARWPSVPVDIMPVGYFGLLDPANQPSICRSTELPSKVQRGFVAVQSFSSLAEAHQWQHTHTIIDVDAATVDEAVVRSITPAPLTYGVLLSQGHVAPPLQHACTSNAELQALLADGWQFSKTFLCSSDATWWLVSASTLSPNDPALTSVHHTPAPAAPAPARLSVQQNLPSATIPSLIPSLTSGPATSSSELALPEGPHHMVSRIYEAALPFGDHDPSVGNPAFIYGVDKKIRPLLNPFFPSQAFQQAMWDS
jgi:hypothetical protein